MNAGGDPAPGPLAGPAGGAGLTAPGLTLVVEAAGIPALALAAFSLMYKGAFASWFSWQNTLTRAAPLILTALCTALPARVGLMIIGGEGAFVLGGLAAAAAAIGVAALFGPAAATAAPLLTQLAMAAAGMAAGGLWIGLAAWLRHARGVNETISSLLLSAIAIAILNQMVDGPLRDPASLNKPSTPPLPDALMIGNIPGTQIHWGLAMGIAVCILAYIVLRFTTAGFAARVVGGNAKVARMAGIGVGPILIGAAVAGGASAGLAGMVEVAAVQGQANAALAAGYGLTGILVAFLARHNPLAVIPVAVLLGGIGASNGLLQRHLNLPDATSLVFQGVLFVAILASETLYGRLPAWPMPRLALPRAARLPARERP